MSSKASSTFDLSMGFAPVRDRCLDAPSGEPFFSENFMFSTFDPKADIGLWLHLGTWPTDFGLWEDQVLISLPDDQGLLWMYSYHRTARERRPAGASFAARCEEPFRRWTLTFDGVGVRTANDEMCRELVRDGKKEPFSFELSLEMAGPVWDAHMSASSPVGRGSMAEQAWAHDHYEQLYRATGEIRLKDGTIPFSGTGVRDHSRGPRGPNIADKFGGHALVGVLYESGRAFGLQRIWTPDGTVTLDTGYVFVENQFHHAEVLEVPRLRTPLRTCGEEMRLGLRSPLGEHWLRGELLKASVVTLSPYITFGADYRLPNPRFFQQGHARWIWDDEDGYGLTERSGTLLP